MLHDKSTNVLSELKNYFRSNEKTFFRLFTELRSLKISDKMFQSADKINSQYFGFQKFIILILFPLFDIKHISGYKESSLYPILNCGKDVFYRFLNNPGFSWRKLAYQVNKGLIYRVEKASDNTANKPVKCLIVDDTDLHKRGKGFELVSRIFSHVTHSFAYGFKCLMPGYQDGRSFFALDFSLHGEKGDEKKKNYKPYL